jgi:hypothetical protein
MIDQFAAYLMFFQAVGAAAALITFAVDFARPRDASCVPLSPPKVAPAGQRPTLVTSPAFAR